MNAAVNEDDRDLLPVLVMEPWVIENRSFLPADAQLAAHRGDLHSGFMAQVAVRFPDDRDPWTHCSP